MFCYIEYDRSLDETFEELDKESNEEILQNYRRWDSEYNEYPVIAKKGVLAQMLLKSKNARKFIRVYERETCNTHTNYRIVTQY